MSRYRKVDPRFWKDEKVINLSPEEKLIALYLFTGQSNRIGLFNFSPGEAAEDLGLCETFAEGFEKVCRAMNFGWDKTFRVLYLPTWWKYNCPENPNVLKACLSDLHEVPNTRLITAFSDNLAFLPETFHETFRKGLGKPSPICIGYQEQEQEQDNNSGAKAPKSFPNKRSRKLTRLQLAPAEFEQFYSAYPRHVDKAGALKAWTALGPNLELVAEIMAGVERYAESVKDSESNFIKYPGPWLNARRWEDEPASRNGAANVKPEIKDLGNGYVEIDGRRMDRQTYERRYGTN